MMLPVKYRSRVNAWLFVVIHAFLSTVIYAQSSNTITLVRNKEKAHTITTSALGVAVAIGSGKELFVLYDVPPVIVGWSGSTLLGEYAGVPGTMDSPTDIDASGMDILVTDRWRSEILRFNRRLKQVPSIKLTANDQYFEPVSICRGKDGTLFVLNRADSDIWIIKPDGTSAQVGAAKSRYDWLTDPRQIIYISRFNLIAVIDGNRVTVSNTFGKPQSVLPTTVENLVRIDCWDRELWVLGDGLECIELTTGERLFHVPADSLKSWGVYPPADLAVQEDKLYILPVTDGGVISLSIERNTNN